MKIFYAILTGSIYKNDRNLWIEDTWVQRIDKEDDYAFLEGEADPDRNVLGWRTKEGHYTSYLKLIGLYQHVYENWEEFRQYDWIFLSDSDCYVYPGRAKEFLSNFETQHPLFIGRANKLEAHPGAWHGTSHNCQLSDLFLKKVPNGSFFCHSGGAGWALNRSGVYKLAEYLTNNKPMLSMHYDLAHALWLNDCDIPIMHSRKFREEPHHDMKNWGDYVNDDVITHHYMTKKDFYEVDKRLDQDK